MANVVSPGLAVTYIRSTSEPTSVGLGALAMCLRASFTSP
eukprot:CAMPEP_0174355036 /NCGR_PEP_ID=MMETSP0811_2-20130205/22901_1 /TAXON_ID=73025 ORGANISM="Eutreptiella gymnastica-like, Strain CCMP1594" /NCGR_SAMPLE_ID=MMETSP0811_2 /ASSEMBLY_ACC=CAM_ASM_000667 /LENGTH=39 /DNA_ID= /DNA_START= /DNA_END= /DNA_ORIENTATION=